MHAVISVGMASMRTNGIPAHAETGRAFWMSTLDIGL